MTPPSGSVGDGALGAGRARSVTLVVSDLEGSTALAERLDAETLRSVLTRYFTEMQAVLESHGGAVAKIIGDALVTVFEHGDDPAEGARRAARAVLEARETLEWLNDRFEGTWAVRLRHRTGLASGELGPTPAGAGPDDPEVLTGEVMGTAESLEARAGAMEALVDERTRALLGDHATLEAVGPVARKGREGSLEAWRLVAVQEGDGEPERTGVRPAVPSWRCGVCGGEQDHDVPWCRNCGAARPGSDALRESRRTVTVVFADARPVTVDGAQPPTEVTRLVRARYASAVRPILEAHGGTVERSIGDAVMAVFGLPVRHEDDAARAVRAAADVRAAVAALEEELVEQLGVRVASKVGVNSGGVVAGDVSEGHRLVTGDAVNVAARLAQTAADGDVVLGELTRRLAGDVAEVEPLAPLVLRGKAEPVPAHRLVRVAVNRGASRRHDLPLVGRDAELDALRAVLREAEAEGRATRVTLVGDAGVGKSRLTHEFLSEAGRRARVLRGSCVSYGDGMTFWPLAGVVRDAADVAEGDDAEASRARIAALVADEPEVGLRLQAVVGLVDTPFAVPELAWGMRRMLERLAAEAPVVVLVDDVHWAEPTLLDVLDDLQRSVRAPVTFLCTSRPVERDAHGAFVEASPVVRLEPLSDAQCEHFLHLLLGETGVDGGALARIVEAAGGNPLFLEQLLAMLLDDGRLQQLDGRWRIVGDLASLEVPASIEALLAARLDRLDDGERDVIGPASVVGRRFAQAAVAHLVAPHLRDEVGRLLVGLGSRDLVLPDEVEPPVFRFQHQLIRDATYQGLLKQVRAHLHEQFVRWSDARRDPRELGVEVEEVQGYHLEQAYRCLRELGPLDDHAVSLGIDGSRRLAWAGERALGRGDMPAAANLLVRAVDLLPASHPGAARVLLLAGNALHETGAFDRAIDAYGRSAEAAAAAGQLDAREAALVERLRLEYLIGRVDDVEHVVAELEGTFDRLRARGDADALSRAWQLRLNVDIAACQWADAQRAAAEVIGQARRAGNAVLEVRTMPLLAFLAQKGPMPVADATRACREILERVAFDRRSSTLTQLELATLSAMAVDIDGARATYRDARAVLSELGWEMQAALVSLSSGPIELGADEPARAEAELRRDYEALQEMGERNFISLTAALLAEAVYRQGRFDEAAELVAVSRSLVAPDDLAVLIILGCTAAKLASRRGDHAAGLAEVHEALERMRTTDDPSGEGDVLLDLSEVVFLGGDRAEAATAIDEARRRYGEKGNLAGVGRAERLRADLEAGRDPLGQA